MPEPVEEYDKYSQATPVPEGVPNDSFAPQSVEEHDPYSMATPESSERSLNEQTKSMPLRGLEKDVARFSPNLYAAGATALSLFPYATILGLPSARDDFMQMSKEDQTNLLLMDALGAALWGKGHLVAKDIGWLGKQLLKKPLASLGEKLTLMKQAKKAQIVPYEDAVRRVNSLAQREVIKPFSYAEEVKKSLGGKGFGADEAEAMASELLGEEGALQNLMLERGYAGKKISKALDTATTWEKGRLYPRRVLKAEAREEFGEEAVRGRAYQRNFESLLVSDVLKAKPSKNTINAIFEAQLRRTFPEKLLEGEGKVGFGDLTPHQAMNLMADMLEHKAASWKVTYPVLMATMHPARVVFGIGEEGLGMLSNVYKPIKAALGRMNRNYFNHSLLFAKMLEQRGAYTSIAIKETGEFSVKKAPWLTAKVQDEAYKVVRLMDDLSGQIAKAEGALEGEGAEEGAMLIEELQKEIAQATAGASQGAKHLISTWKAFSDHLYSEHVKMQIPRLFRKAGLTRFGQARIDEMMTGPNGLGYEIDRLFSSMAETNPTEKVKGVQDILAGLKKRLEFNGKKHPYFTAEGKELAKAIKKLEVGLEWGKKDGFLRYFDNYTSRVSQHEDMLLQKWRGGLFAGQQSAFYTKLRQLEKMKGIPVDFGTAIQARTMAHAKEHFLYDKLDDVVKFTEKLPPAWIEYTEGYLGGILGTPTLSDYKVAMFMTKTVGNFERFFGKGEGLWNEQRVMNLAYTLNNMAYLGGLGFKPFSAARNLFQPLLSVPSDLGGLKDLGKLAEGYKWAANPENRKYLISLGAVEEYAPEIYLRPRILPQGKTLFGKEMPTMEGARDAAMWMFKASDRLNRYVAGGAAAIKWDRTFKAFNGQIKPNEVLAFSRKMNLGGRYEWIKADIEDLLFRGKVSEAKAVFVKDVIADTQYLYGVADAPVVLRKHGAIGRTGFLFQSWWMNYGTMLEKWLSRGQSPGAQVERMFTGMLSQGLAFAMMEPLWGRYTAVRSTFLGPFPNEFNEFLIPPSWKPVYHASVALLNISSPNVSARHAKATLDSAMIMVPAGLQLKAFYRGAKEEGFEGFSKAIIGMKPRKASE